MSETGIVFNFCERLGQSHGDLALCLQIIGREPERWERGRECEGILKYLKGKDRLHELKDALVAIDREDLVNLSEDVIQEIQAPTSFSGKVKIKLCRRLGKNWLDLADYLEIPEYDRSRFKQGYECQEIWEWLRERNRLYDLKTALKYLERQDLVDLLDN